jgi:hypothetical protein
MTAEGGGTTETDVTHGFALLMGEHVSPASQKLILMSVQDIGYFEPMSFHRRILPFAWLGVWANVRVSSGLMVVCRRRSETCR